MVNIRIGKDKLFLTFPFYKIDIQAIVKSFNKAQFISATKVFELPIENYDRLIQLFKENGTPYEVDGKPIENKKTYLKTKLFKHQQDFLNLFTGNVIFLADEQGLGKSLSAIAAAVERKEEKGYQHCLIVVGVNGLRYNWKHEIELHSGESCIVLGDRINRNGKLVNDGTKAKLKQILEVPEEYFWIINIEALRDKELSKTIQEYCKKDIIQMCIADETHRCGKDPNTLQGKGFLKIKSESKIALTGTPLLNNPLDLFIILKWLGAETHTWTEFKEHHCIYGGFGNSELLGYKNMNELKQSLNSVMIRRLKDDVLDLPPKIYTTEYVIMESKQKAIYEEVLTAVREDVDKIKLSPNPLTMLIRLRQATAHTSILSSEISESIKFERAKQMIDEIVYDGGSVVVFSCFKNVINLFNTFMKEYKPAIVTGDVTGTERQREIEKFQSGNTNLIIGTVGALGTGFTLTKARTVIFLDSPWNRATKDQCTDRIHRIGQTGTCNIITLVCKGTLDEKIESIVARKGKMSDAIVDGKLESKKGEVVEWLLNSL